MRPLHTRLRNPAMLQIKATSLASHGAVRACHTCCRQAQLENRQPLSREVEHHKLRLHKAREASTRKQARWAFPCGPPRSIPQKPFFYAVMRTAQTNATTLPCPVDDDGLRSDRMIDRFRALPILDRPPRCGPAQNEQNTCPPSQRFSRVRCVINPSCVNPSKTHESDNTCSFHAGPVATVTSIRPCGRNLGRETGRAAARPFQAFRRDEKFNRLSYDPPNSF